MSGHDFLSNSPLQKHTAVITVPFPEAENGQFLRHRHLQIKRFIIQSVRNHRQAILDSSGIRFPFCPLPKQQPYIQL